MQVASPRSGSAERGRCKSKLNTISLRNWVAIVVVIVWSVAAVVAFFTANFEELGIVTPVMMIVVGFVFGYKAEYTPPPDDNDKWSHLP